jgi:hypothetical protein
MNQPNPGTGPRFAGFSALCAEHQAEISLAVRGILIGSAIVLAIIALLMQALAAHPLPPITSNLIGSAAFSGFDPMVPPAIDPMAADLPVDATAILSGMFLAVVLITGGFASLAFLADCAVRAGAIAHRLGSGRKLPEAGGGD